MGAKNTYRHNIMAVNSIDTFLSIRGGYNNKVRDVYFVRGVGEPKGLPDLIVDIDKKMGIEMSNGHLKYIRINALPSFKDIKDTEYYAAAYDTWSARGAISLRNLTLHRELQEAVCDAYAQIIQKYTDTKKTATGSMIRNFATKILFWLDQIFPDILKDWTERSCIKVIADNVVKDQQYLFYLFLTLLGCDVLLIENRADLALSEDLTKYTYVLELGGFGSSKLREYVPYVPERAADRNRAAAGSGTMGQRPRIVLPERSQRTAYVLQQDSGTEKSFEELARLASSIVQIAVHDQEGKVIGTGSGIMVGQNGFILTNHHVTSGGSFYSVRIEDDEEVYATDEVIKYNTTTDLAVIRIQRRLNPIPIYRGRKELVRGQKVVAIGSPLGLFNSVSDGIISGFRHIDDVDMIQFTAPISPGSSGGAVLNMQGEVIGISTAGIDNGQNINLAVGYGSIRMFAGGFLD